jgi:hypothetical protein
MTDEQENNQILTHQPQTISQGIDEFDLPVFTDTDKISAPTATPAEISSETAQQENDLTTPTALTQSAIEIPPIEDDFTPFPTEATAENHAANQSISREYAAETTHKTDIIVVDTLPEIQPVKIPAIVPEDATANRPENQTVNSEPKQPKIWQLLTVFLSGMLVGSVISLGTLLVWRMYQERANIQIKLPADVPLPQSPSPALTTPARPLAGIPPAPGTASPIPTDNSINNPTNNPSPNPTQIPSLSGVPQLASPSPQPSPLGSGEGGISPTNSPSVAETAVTERVSFEAGATGTTLSNNLPDNKSKRYLIDCRGGQTMTLNVPEGAVSATIIAPNGEKVGTANSTTPWEGQLPASGDYTIEISGESQANYGVKIEVK